MSYVTKEEIKSYLDFKAGDDDKDVLIDKLILSAESFIEDFCNRVFTKASVTEYHSGGSDRIFLKRFPIASTPAVQVWDSWDRTYGNGDLIDPDDYFVDTENGILMFDYPVGGSPGAVKVTYTGGYTTIPHAIRQACIELAARKVKEGPSGGLGVPTRAIPEGGSVTFQIDDILPQTKIALLTFRKPAGE